MLETGTTFDPDIARDRVSVLTQTLFTNGGKAPWIQLQPDLAAAVDLEFRPEHKGNLKLEAGISPRP